MPGLELHIKEDPHALVYVSVAALARIEVGEHLLLSRNQRSFEGGRMVYTPLGGAVQLGDLHAGFLEEHLNRVDAKPRKGDDLRFDVAQGRLDEVIVLLKDYSNFRQGAAAALYRELREELVDELKLVPDLPAEMLRSSFMHTIMVREEENSEGFREQVQRVYAVHDVEIQDPWCKGRIFDGLQDGRMLIATPEDIERGSARGKRIGRNSWAILKNAEELYRKSPSSDPQAVSVEYPEQKVSQ